MRLAAIVVEPGCNRAQGGMNISQPGLYRPVCRELADRHNVLLILDEIATRGSAGQVALFAAYPRGESPPDICCTRKRPMTGGYMSMAGHTLHVGKLRSASSQGGPCRC